MVFQLLTLLYSPCHHCASPCNAEHIFYWQLEWLVQGALGDWDVRIYSLHTQEAQLSITISINATSAL
jgi:hypothetical protein